MVKCFKCNNEGVGKFCSECGERYKTTEDLLQEAFHKIERLEEQIKNTNKVVVNKPIKRKYKGYTKSEIDLINKLYKEDKSAEYIARELKRSVSGIYSCLTRHFNIRRRKLRKYTKAEIETVKTLHKKGESYKEIAKKLGRTFDSIGHCVSRYINSDEENISPKQDKRVTRMKFKQSREKFLMDNNFSMNREDASKLASDEWDGKGKVGIPQPKAKGEKIMFNWDKYKFDGEQFKQIFKQALYSKKKVCFFDVSHLINETDWTQVVAWDIVKNYRLVLDGLGYENNKKLKIHDIGVVELI